jgi:hypothetical protein
MATPQPLVTVARGQSSGNLPTQATLPDTQSNYAPLRQHGKSARPDELPNQPEQPEQPPPQFIPLLDLSTTIIFGSISFVLLFSLVGIKGTIMTLSSSVLTPLSVYHLIRLTPTNLRLVKLGILSIFATLIAVEFTTKQHCISLCYSEYKTYESMAMAMYDQHVPARCTKFCISSFSTFWQ